MLFVRRLSLYLLTAVAASACGQDPTYTLAWRFANEAPGPFTARSCGLAGVESFEGVEAGGSLVALPDGSTEFRPDGSSREFRAVCGAGRVVRRIEPGTWVVMLAGVDPSGRIPSSSAAPMSMILKGTSAPFNLQLDEPTPVVEVVVTPRSTCTDGIDNNSNGLVDADDAGCVAGGVEPTLGPNALPSTKPLM